MADPERYHETIVPSAAGKVIAKLEIYRDSEEGCVGITLDFTDKSSFLYQVKSGKPVATAGTEENYEAADAGYKEIEIK